MRFARIAAVSIATLVAGATIISLAGATSSAEEKSVQAPRPAKYVARLALEVPDQPRYIAAMLGIDPASAQSFRFSPQDLVARTSIPAVAQRVAEDPTLSERNPEYFARFDPEEGEFDREALASDLASRTSCTIEPGSNVIVVRVFDQSESVARELCSQATAVILETNASTRQRRILSARDAADRKERDLRAQLDALAIEHANIVATGTVSSMADEHASGILRERMIDVELSLVGLPETDAAHAVLIQRRDWLQSQLAIAEQTATQRAQNQSRLQYIEDQRATKQQLRAAAARAVLALDEELAAPQVVRLDHHPVTESRE